MKKKKYIAPECTVVELETVEVLAGSITLEGDDSFGSTGEGGGTDMGANRHRGEWGDLWAGRK